MTNSGAAARCIALVSARVARTHDTESPLLQAALRARGLAATIVDWDDAAVDWSRFALAIVRSAWDYSGRLAEFQDWLDRAALATRVFNPAAVIRWSLDKHYLAELSRARVATVPTAYVEPGEDVAAMLARFLQNHATAELVVKPAVGCNAQDVQRYQRAATAAIGAHISRLLVEGRSALLQPYLERVDEHGETALIYIKGEFSHAIVKSAVLGRAQAPRRESVASEKIATHRAASDELEFAARVLARLPFDMPLYARIDLLRDAGGAIRLLELELAEPSLYLAYSRQAPVRLADAVAELL
jgi:glutathione synthase/RimK-type ligase-like ATP-grasp enzyme